MSRPMSRSRRWQAAVQKAQDALGAIRTAESELEAALDDLLAVQEEYDEWRSNLPENLGGSVLAEKLDEVCDLEITTDAVTEACNDVEQLLESAEAIDLPRGFGRD